MHHLLLHLAGRNIVQAAEAFLLGLHGHGSLTATLCYSSLVGADLQAAHRRAGAIERLRLE
jgi:hypothetical protein